MNEISNITDNGNLTMSSREIAECIIMDRRTALKTISAGIPAPCLAASHAGMPVPDTDLAQLGLEFEAAWKAEQKFYAAHHLSDFSNDDGLGAALERTEECVNKIISAKANTLDDIKVKARAFEWCRGDDLDPGDTADARLVYQIITTILKI